jgi:hypothetical protein
MIFGFNTDIRHADTVYHVQSEARVADLLLQTQVFVGGRCLGKHATSYAQQATLPDFSEREVHELLKRQHRLVLEAVREGRLAALLAASGSVADAGAPGLALQWLNTHNGFSQGVLRLRFLVSRQGRPVSGAHLSVRLGLAPDAPVHSQATTAPDGTAELCVAWQEAAGCELAILVHALHAGASASRKFRLRKCVS